jgi:hypothetical protein
MVGGVGFVGTGLLLKSLTAHLLIKREVTQIEPMGIELPP